MTVDNKDAQQIANAVRDNLSPDLQGIAIGLGSIAATLATISQEMHNNYNVLCDLRTIERARAETVGKYAASQTHEIDAIKTDANKKLRKHRLTVQNEYDLSQSEIFRDFVDSVRIDTEHIEQVKQEYAHLHEMEESALNDIEKNLLSAPKFIYDSRLGKITDQKSGILTNLVEFIDRRSKILKDIDNMQTNIELPTSDRSKTMLGSEFMIPFWVIGVSIKGKNRIIVLPLANRSTPKSKPTKATPYSEHLGPLSNAFDTYRHMFTSDENIKIARNSSILARKGEIIERLNSLTLRGSVDVETFVGAMKKFEKSAFM